MHARDDNLLDLEDRPRSRVDRARQWRRFVDEGVFYRLNGVGRSSLDGTASIGERKSEFTARPRVVPVSKTVAASGFELPPASVPAIGRSATFATEDVVDSVLNFASTIWRCRSCGHEAVTLTGRALTCAVCGTVFGDEPCGECIRRESN